MCGRVSGGCEKVLDKVIDGLPDHLFLGIVLFVCRLATLYSSLVLRSLAIIKRTIECLEFIAHSLQIHALYDGK